MAANNVNWGVVVMLLTCYVIAFGLAIAAEEHRAQVHFPQPVHFPLYFAQISPHISIKWILSPKPKKIFDQKNMKP
jgi:hypothetical protein